MPVVTLQFLFKSPPEMFRYLLRDALVLMGLPYGPQARQQLAHTLPDLFGRSNVTLSGYEHWLARNAKLDTVGTFAEFMEPRYQRWLRGSRQIR